MTRTGEPAGRGWGWVRPGVQAHLAYLKTTCTALTPGCSSLAGRRAVKEVGARQRAPAEDQRGTRGPHPHPRTRKVPVTPAHTGKGRCPARVRERLPRGGLGSHLEFRISSTCLGVSAKMQGLSCSFSLFCGTEGTQGQPALLPWGPSSDQDRKWMDGAAQGEISSGATRHGL